jgi:multidrug resistance efflux pump
MAEPKKVPKVFTILAALLLVGPIAFAAWYFNRPKVDPTPLKTMEELDVICIGRIDSAKMVISLEPATAGRVVEILVEENAEVKADQPLVKLDDTLAMHRKKQAEAAEVGATLEKTRAVNEAARFPQQIEVRQAMTNSILAQVRAAEKNLEVRKVLSGLNKPGEAELSGLQAIVDQLKELHKAEEIQLRELKKMLAEKQPDLLVQAAEAKLKAARADLELAQRGVDDCTIRAPGAGRILRLQANKGGVLLPGGYMPSIVFAPAGKLVIRAEVDQEFLGKVKVGKKVMAEDESRLDSPKWIGQVKSVSRWVANRRTIILDPGEINDVRTVECVVELETDQDLVIGQRMRVRIMMK